MRRFAFLLALAWAAPALAQDSDGDGAADSADAYPCDATRAATAFAPAEDQYGLLVFEDQWPARGDEDFNDVVVAYNYVYRLDAQNRAISVRANLHVLALGGDFDPGLGLHLPLPRAAVASVTRQVGATAPAPLTPEATDGELTVRVLDDLRSLFGGRSGPINSRDTDARAVGASIVVEVTLSTPTAIPSGAAPHDLFVYRSQAFAHQIHRPAFAGTAAMDTALFGTADDGSTPSRNFVDDRNLPFVLELPVEAPYPAEGVALSALYPQVLTFAASGGLQAADFYATPVGAHAYADMNGLGPVPATAPAAEPPADRSCVPVAPGVSVGTSAYLTRTRQTTRWSLNNGTAYTEYLLRGEGWQQAGDHYDDTYEITFFDEAGADLTTGRHGAAVQCTFVTDGSCSGPCSAVPGHLFDGRFAWYGPHYSSFWELLCTFDRPVIVREIQNSNWGPAYSHGPRTLFGRRGDGALVTVPLDGNQPCTGCRAHDITIPWGGGNTVYLTPASRP